MSSAHSAINWEVPLVSTAFIQEFLLYLILVCLENYNQSAFPPNIVEAICIPLSSLSSLLRPLHLPNLIPVQMSTPFHTPRFSTPNLSSSRSALSSCRVSNIPSGVIVSATETLCPDDVCKCSALSLQAESVFLF